MRWIGPSGEAALRDAPCPLLEAGSDTTRSPLPGVEAPEEVCRDYAAVGLSLRAHPVSFLSGELARRGAVPCADLGDANRFADGAPAAVAGLVLLRKRPATARGMVFVTLEDESGIVNLMVRPEIYERFRREVRHAPLVIARGRVQREGAIVHLVARDFEDPVSAAPRPPTRGSPAVPGPQR